MSQTMKRLTVALLCVLLFATAFSLAFFYGGTTAADASVQYEDLIVERQGLIYASDNSSDLIKERLSVYGVTAEGEKVLLDPSEYVVHLGGADGATSGWTLSTTQNNNFTVTAGSLSAGFSAVAAAVAPGSVRVTTDFRVDGNQNVTASGSTLYLYTHDNVKQHITVVGYNNDGRPYNGTEEASVITDYVISGSTLPGLQTLTVTWSSEDFSFSDSFPVVLTQDSVASIEVKEGTIPQNVKSSATVGYLTFANGGLEVIVKYNSGKEETLSGNALSAVTFTGYLNDKNAEAGTVFDETITASYQGKSCTFVLPVTAVAPTSIQLYYVPGTIGLDYSALDIPDLTFLSGVITYADGMKMIQSLPAEEYDVEYVNSDGNHSNDGFRMGDTAIIVTYKEGGKQASVTIDGITVSQIVLPLPVLDSTLMTYNGKEQTKGFDSGLDEKIMQVTVTQGNAKWEKGALHFTAAGTYKVTVTITNENYIFSDGKDFVSYTSYTFSVSKIEIDKSALSVNVSGWQYLSYEVSNYPKVDGLPESVTQEDVTFRFYGQSADGNFNVQDFEAKTLSPQELSELGVGTYYVIASISETENYKPCDVPGRYSFSVSKRSLAVPSGLDRVYNEKPQQANVEGLTNLGVLYTMACDSQTDVGDYNATFTLYDEAFANYHWEGKGQDEQSVTVTWHITRGKNQVTVTIENADNWTYGDKEHNVSYNLTFDKDAVVTVTYRGADGTAYDESAKVPTNAGNYIVKVSVAETHNYTEAETEARFTIKRQPLAFPTVNYGTSGDGYVYSGETIYAVLSAAYFTDGDVTVSEYIKPYFTVLGDFSGKDAKEYSFTLTPTANYCWTGGGTSAHTVTWKIISKTLAKPTADGGTFVYDTTAKTYTLAGFDKAGMTISVTAADPDDSDGLVNHNNGSVTAVRAGTYNITVTPKTNYVFDGEESYSYVFEIAQKPLTAPTSDDTNFIYNGDKQTYVLGGFIASEMKATATNEATVDGGRVTATNAGTYVITVAVANDNYKWADGTNPTYDFIINRQGIEKPSVVYPGDPDGYVYDYGNDITVQISPESDGFTKDGDITVKDAGDYTLILTLNDNFVWSDGSSEPYELQWKVVQRQISLPTLSDTHLTYNGETQDVNVYGLDENAVTLTLTTSADGASLTDTTLSVLHAGTYTVTATLKNENFVWAREYKDLVLNVAQAANAISDLTIAGWTYGGTANAPNFTANFGFDTATVTYRGADGTAYDESENVPTNAGKYTVTVTIAAKSDYAGATAKVSFVVDRMGVDMPSITGEYDYNGDEQTVKLFPDGESQGYFTVVGGKQTNAGTYTVTLKLSSNYRWSGDVSDFDSQQREHVFQNGWTISPLALDAISLEHAETTVVDDNAPGTPQEQTNVLEGFNTSYPDAYTITLKSGNSHAISRNGATLKATNADTYTVTVALASNNFVWSDGGVGYILTWKINRKTVVVQNADVDRQIEYNNSAQYPAAIYDTSSPYYTASGFYVYNDKGDKQSIDSAPSNYGTYYMAFTLKNASDYVWTKDGHGGEGAGQSDSAEGNVIYVWFAITKAGYDINASLINNSFTYGATLSTKEDIDWQITVEEVSNAIESGKITVEYRFRGTGSTDYGGEQGSTTAPQAAGTYTVTVYVNGETANYRAQGSAALEFTIKPKTLTVTFVEENNGYVFTYGEAQPVRVTYEGFVYDDTENVLDATVKYNGDEDNPVNVGSYTVTAAFTNTNYVLADGTRSDTRSYVINPATLEVTVGSQTVVYGEKLGGWSVSVTGFKYSDSGTLETALIDAVKEGISHSYEQGDGVGTYGITVTPDEGEWSSNYTVVCNSYDSETQQGATITVNARAITVTIHDKTSVYGSDIEEFTADVQLNDGQAVTGSAVYGNDSVYDLSCDDVKVGSNVGSYYITGTATNDNYAVTFQNSDGSSTMGKYTVTPAQITVNAVGYVGIYDATEHPVLNYKASSADVTHSSAFDATWTFSLTQDGEYTTELDLKEATDGTTVYYKVTDPNHDTATGYFTVKIAKASLTVNVADATVQYGDEVDLSALTLNYSGWQGSDGVEQVDATKVSYTFTAEGTHYAPGAEAGSTFAITASGVTSDNYKITFGNAGILTVVPREITITLLPQTAEYGGQNASYTLGSTPGIHYVVGGKGLYENEDPQVILTADLTSKDVGSYKIVANRPQNGNYAVTVENEDNFLFTITKATVTVTAQDKSVIYGDNAPTLGWNDVTVDGFKDGTDYAAQLGEIAFDFGGYEPRTSQAGSTHDITPQVGESKNYVVITQKGRLSVAVRSITVTIENKTSVYGDSLEELTATTADTVANADGLNKIVSLTKAAGLDAGSYAISGAGKNGNYNVTFKGTNGTTGEYVITPKQAEITITLPTDLEYSGKPMTATADITGLIDSDSALQATITYSGATYDGTSHANESDAPVKAGKYVVTATLPNHNYYLTTDGSSYVYDTSVDMEITKATLTVTVTVGTSSIQYGENAPESSYSYEISGFKHNENEDVLTGRVVYSTSYAPGAEKGSVGTYYVTHDVNAADAFASNNYSFTAKAGSFEVTRRSVEIDSDNLIADTFTYGSASGAEAQLAEAETLPQAIKGDDLGFVYTYSAKEAGDTRKNYPTWVGDYTVTVSITNKNYELTGTVKKAYKITQKQVTVTAVSLSVTYGDSAPTYTATYEPSDFAYNETEHTAGIKGNLVFACDYAPGAAHGSVVEGGYEITVSGVTSRNYSFNFEKGTLTVQKKAITVTFSDRETTYGDAKYVYLQAEVTADALVDGDSKETVFDIKVVDASGTPVEFNERTAAGVYYLYGSEKSGNYAITFAGGHTAPNGVQNAGKHTVKQQTVSVKVTGTGDRTYDGTPKVVTAEITDGALFGETVTLTVYYTGKNGTIYDSSTAAPQNVGTYAISVTADNPNYTSASVSGELIIKPKTVDINWGTTSFTYTGTEQTVKATYQTVAADGGNEVELKLTLNGYVAHGSADSVTNVNFRDAGSYTYVASFADGDNPYGNYALLGAATQTYVITPAEITVAIDDQTSQYGDNIVALTATVTSGEIFGIDQGGTPQQNPVYTLSTTATSASCVDTYYISGNANGARGFNYDVTFTGSAGSTAKYIVTKRQLTVTATYNGNNNVTYGDAVTNSLFALSYERAGGGAAFVNGDDQSVVTVNSNAFGYTYQSGANGTPAGSVVNVTIDVSLLAADNYAFTDSGNSAFTVVKRVITLDENYKNFGGHTYDGSDIWLAATTQDVQNIVDGESVGNEVVFDYAFTYNAGSYVVTVTLSDASANYTFDKDTITFEIAKRTLTVTPDGDLQQEGVQDITVTYGDQLTSEQILNAYLHYSGFVIGENEHSTDILGNVVVTQNYLYADAATRTDAGTTLTVTLDFEEGYAPQNYQVQFIAGQITVLKRKINVLFTGYSVIGHGHTVYGEYGKTINPAKVTIYQGLADGDNAEEEITFSFYYFGTSNDGTWSYTAENAVTVHPILAGTYSVRIEMESRNYEFANPDQGSDGSAHTEQNIYTVLKQRVTAPTWQVDSLPATGEEQENVISGFNNTLYEYVTAGSDNNQTPSVQHSGNTVTMTATYAGSYWATFKLLDSHNYVWADLTATEEGYDTPTIDVKWSISAYNDLTVEIVGVDLDGDGNADVLPTEGKFNHTWTYGDVFGTVIAKGSYNGGQSVFTGTITITFYLEGTDERVANCNSAGSYYVVASVAGTSDFNAAQSDRVYFTVNRKQVAIPKAESVPYDDGNTVSATLENFQNGIMSVVGVAQGVSYAIDGDGCTLSAINAGSYYVNVSLTDRNNYEWTDGTDTVQGVRWTVARKSVDKPALPSNVSYEFNNQQHTYDVDQSSYYTVSGTTSATNVGTYTVEVRLVSTSNYVWSDETTAAINVTWKITQAQNGFVTHYDRNDWTYGDAASAETLPTMNFGIPTVSYYTDAECKEPYLGTFGMSTAAGTYYAKVTVAETNNYTALEEVKSFTVAKATAQAVWSAGDLTYNSTDKASVITATFYEKVSGSYVELQVTVTGGQMVNAGDYNLTATLPEAHANNYTLTNAEASYTVAKASVTVTLHAQSAQYTGQTPTVDQHAYSISGNTYEQDLGITLSIAAGSVNVGSYDITATHTNGNFNVNYLPAKFEITAAPLTVEITANGGSYGNVTAATAIAKDAQGETVETQIVLTYTGQSNDGESYNNTVAPQKAGSYVVTATLADVNYALTGNNTATFTVSKARLVVEITTSASYNGELQKATVKVTGGDESLYTLTNNGGTDVGNYPVSLTLQDTYNYVWYYNDAEFGGATLTVNFNITIADNAVTVSGVDGWTYGEQAVIPSATATFGNATVMYSTAADGVYVTDVPVNAGTYFVKAVVAETANYRGAESKPQSFEIAKAQNGFVTHYERDDWTYGEAASKETLPTMNFGIPTVSYFTDEARTQPYTGDFNQYTPAGTYYVTVRVEGSENFEALVSVIHSFTVHKKQVAKPTLQYASVVETGQTLQNRVAGLDDRVMQVINLQSGITSDGNGYVLTEKNPGVYSITVALSDNANYTWTDGGNESVTLSWTIRRAQLQAWTEDSQNRYPEAVVHSPQGIHPDFLLQVVAVAEEMYGNYDLSQFGRVSIAMGYEVSLFSGGAEVQPEGEITVRLRVSSDIDPQVHTLLHLRDGQWQEVDYVVTDGYAVLTTDALSPMLFVTATPMYLVWTMAALGCILVAELIVLAAAVKKRRQGRNN